MIAPGQGNLLKIPKALWIAIARMFREKKVVDALTEFSKVNLDQLVEKVYDDVDERSWYRESFAITHLNKLIEEDKAVSRGEDFSLDRLILNSPTTAMSMVVVRIFRQILLVILSIESSNVRFPNNFTKAIGVSFD